MKMRLFRLFISAVLISLTSCIIIIDDPGNQDINALKSIQTAESVADLKSMNTDSVLDAVPAAVKTDIFADPQGNLPKLVDYLKSQSGSDDGVLLRYIHDWIVRNIYYDSDSFLAHLDVEQEPYALLKLKKTTCGGYANLFKEMCRLAGLDSMDVSGNTKSYTYLHTGSLGSHVWNAVKLNNSIYFIDSTWDSNNSYMDAAWNSGMFYLSYFLVAPDLFIWEHFPEVPANQALSQPLAMDQFMALNWTVHGQSNITQYGLQKNIQLAGGVQPFITALNAETDITITGLSGLIPHISSFTTPYSDGSKTGWTWFQRVSDNGGIIHFRPGESGYSTIRIWDKAYDDIDNNTELMAAIQVYSEHTTTGVPFPAEYKAAYQNSYSLISPLSGSVQNGSSCSINAGFPGAVAAYLYYFDAAQNKSVNTTSYAISGTLDISYTVSPPAGSNGLLYIGFKTSPASTSVCPNSWKIAGYMPPSNLLPAGNEVFMKNIAKP